MVISTIQSVSHTQNLKNDLCYKFIPAPGTLTAGQILVGGRIMYSLLNDYFLRVVRLRTY